CHDSDPLRQRPAAFAASPRNSRAANAESQSSACPLFPAPPDAVRERLLAATRLDAQPAAPTTTVHNLPTGRAPPDCHSAATLAARCHTTHPAYAAPFQ